MAPGYLWVLSEPGKEATVEEFNGKVIFAFRLEKKVTSTKF